MGVTRNALNWYSRFARTGGKPIPPYKHVVQIGDPTLRKVSEPVQLEKIKTDEIQGIIQRLKYVLEKYNSIGMSAPQIGVNLRIFIMSYTVKQLACAPPEFVKIRQMSYVPFTVFINPTLKVIDYNKVIHHEGCESVRSFSAEVARFNEVEVSGYNAVGEAVTQSFKGWSARMAQHEMDHLDGKLYTDIMDRKSLNCICWEEVNLAKGKVTIPFTP